MAAGCKTYQSHIQKNIYKSLKLLTCMWILDPVLLKAKFIYLGARQLTKELRSLTLFGVWKKNYSEILNMVPTAEH